MHFGCVDSFPRGQDAFLQLRVFLRQLTEGIFSTNAIQIAHLFKSRSRQTTKEIVKN